MGWSCGTRAEPLAIGMGDGKGEGGRGDTVHALGAVELPIIEAWSGLAGVRTVAVLQLWLCNVEISEVISYNCRYSCVLFSFCSCCVLVCEL